MYVREVDLYRRFIYRGDGVPDSHARMCVCGGVYDEQVIIAFLDNVKYLAFTVELHGLDLQPQFGGERKYFPVDVVKGLRAVYIFFPFAEQVQVGPVDYQYLLRFASCRSDQNSPSSLGTAVFRMNLPFP